MGMVVRTNIMAMNANRQLGQNNNQVSKSLEKLSSGFRINRAGDDAAGLAISEKMKAQIKGLDQASSNSQDGISLVQTAEGALTEVHSMLNRMVELATKSANGTIQDPVDREAIQSEVDALLEEIDRIGDSTNFNGINLLDGSLAGAASAGGLTGGKIASFKGAETAAVSGTDASTATVVAAKAQYTIDFSGKTKLGSGETLVFENVATADVTITEGTTANVATADTLQEQLDGIATALNGATGAKYDVTRDGDKLIFKAKTDGAVVNDVAIKTASTGTSMKGAAVATDVAGATAAGINWSTTDTVVVDGTEIKVDWSTLSDDDKALLQKDWTDGDNHTADDIKKATKLLEDTINSAIDTHNSTKGGKVSHIKVTGAHKGSGNAAEFKVASTQKDGDSQVKFTGTANSALGQIMGTAEVKTAAPATALNFSPADISNGKFDLKVGDQTVEVALGALGANATAQDVVDSLNTAIGNALANYDTAHGLTGDSAMAGKLTAKLNADGAIEFTNTTGEKIGFSDKDGGEIAKTLGISAEGKSAAGGGLVLQVGDTGDDFNMVTVSVDDMRSAGLGIAGLDVSNADAARASIDTIKSAINKVSTNRANLGALQNRLEHTINNLDVASENMSAANSRIRDTDMAKEMMEYTKVNVLTQAAQAMLAQANQQPQSILQLLQ